MASSLNGLDGGILDRLYKVIESRRGADPAVSNTARLFAKGTEKIAQKVGEEAVETLIEGLRGKKKELAEESADLLYHLLVLWAHRELPPADVWAALADRVEAPVIASGGVATLADLEALRDAPGRGIAGAICGRALYDGRIALAAAVRRLKEPAPC